jgi:hypothetical protein
MKNSKLIDALKQLNVREQSKYKDLVYSPFFNKNKKVQKLVDYCLRYSPDFEAKAFHKKKAFEVVFDDQIAYNEYQINNIISDALRLLYLYLAQQQIMNHEEIWRTTQHEVLLNRRMVKHLPAVERRLSQLLEQKKAAGYSYFHHNYLLESRLDRSRLLQDGRTYNPHLQHANNTLDQLYWNNKLRIACDMASRNKVINAAYECYFLDTLTAIYQSSPEILEQHPAIQLYYQALQTIQTEQEQDYQKLRELLVSYSASIPVEERYDLYDYAQNYCVKKINSGQTEYYAQILDLYKEMLERDVLLRNGYLTQWSYINILTAGLRLPDFEWTEWFIHNYKKQLQPDVRENVFTYSLASLYFEQDDYHRALLSLQGVVFSDIFYHLSAKIIQLKSYFELEEHEAFLSLLEASKKFLSRNRQLSSYQVQSNSSFFRIVGKLHKLYMQKNILTPDKIQFQLQSIQSELFNTQAIANKGWLRQKVASFVH